MNDPHDLQRFVDAQAPVYARVLSELSAGAKVTHWMWFIFPQLEGLGTSAMARRYAISSPAMARAYWDHPLLGPRLKECTERVLAVRGRSARDIFHAPDDLKFRSSMTLFAQAVPQEPLFGQALDRYFGGEPDPRTIERL